MKEIDKFYHSLMQDVQARTLANEDGGTQEQMFTSMAVDSLVESGETENAEIVYYEHDLRTRNQQKINGFAISENLETVDLFITIFNQTQERSSIPKASIEQAATRIANVFRRAIYGDYVDELPETSPIFNFAFQLGDPDNNELRQALIRVNAFIITNGEYKGDIPNNLEICGYKIFYRIIDINYLFRTQESNVPIEMDFSEGKYKIPCVSMPVENADYQAYVAIIPGECLADLYERYGARLLEQNVRAFLQFTGKINKGIRKTIKEEPHMFLAYNNGIAATADHIELDRTGHYIKSISNLQIVNGGQTTASIYYTAKKDKADISGIFVQAKVSVISDKEKFHEIVSNISQYANTQNKVNNADFTSNNPSLVAIEHWSRYLLTPISYTNSLQTYWFFERVRGQYKTLRLKEGFTKARLKEFERKYPKNQVITKVELAKYENAYCEVWDGRKLLVGPHIVVRGNEKNYSIFMAYSLPKNDKKIDNIFFEDAVAKAILFRTADKLYGTKRSGNQLGELKQVVVPYTLGLLNLMTKNKLNLYKIWENQKISDQLADFVYGLMKQVNEFIPQNSPSKNCIEWAKKEECWNEVKSHSWDVDVDSIADDLINEFTKSRTIIKIESDKEEVAKNEEKIRDISPKIWEKIKSWGEETHLINSKQLSRIFDITYNIKFKKPFKINVLNTAIAIFNIVVDNNIDLLYDEDENSADGNNVQQENLSSRQITSAKDITLDVIAKMLAWENEHPTLDRWKVRFMNDVLAGSRALTPKLQHGFLLNYFKLADNGFKL